MMKLNCQMALIISNTQDYIEYIIKSRKNLQESLLFKFTSKELIID